MTIIDNIHFRYKLHKWGGGGGGGKMKEGRGYMLYNEARLLYSGKFSLVQNFTKLL
jgi:hypothetical protein